MNFAAIAGYQRSTRRKEFLFLHGQGHQETAIIVVTIIGSNTSSITASTAKEGRDRIGGHRRRRCCHLYCRPNQIWYCQLRMLSNQDMHVHGTNGTTMI
jgi:hypothetical protein